MVELDKSSPEYPEWLAEVHGEMKARQIVPWEVDPRSQPPVPPPPPPHRFDNMMPSGGHQRSDLLENGLNSVSPAVGGAPANYYLTYSPNYAGRQILDGFVNYENGQDAFPTIKGTFSLPLISTLPPPNPVKVTTLIADWIGYQENVDSSSGGSTLAQVGIHDYISNANSTTGTFTRSLVPFYEFYPDPSQQPLGMAFYPGDTVGLTLTYVSGDTFKFRILDSNAYGTAALTEVISLSAANDTACASGVSGAGTLLTVCNNGDLAEWIVEDHGLYPNGVLNTEQNPPTTFPFGTITITGASVEWGNGDFKIPDNSACSIADCQFNYQQADLSPAGASGIGNPNDLVIIPAWYEPSVELNFPYQGPPAPGFNWPTN
jgi:hypothetical protein